MAIIRLGHENYDINENHIIIDNGSNYVIITKDVGSGLDSFHPTISKADFNDLRTHGMIFTNNELMRTARENEKQNTVTYWKFRMGIDKSILRINHIYLILLLSFMWRSSYE